MNTNTIHCIHHLRHPQCIQNARFGTKQHPKQQNFSDLADCRHNKTSIEQTASSPLFALSTVCNHHVQTITRPLATSLCNRIVIITIVTSVRHHHHWCRSRGQHTGQIVGVLTAHQTSQGCIDRSSQSLVQIFLVSLPVRRTWSPLHGTQRHQYSTVETDSSVATRTIGHTVQ